MYKKKNQTATMGMYNPFVKPNDIVVFKNKIGKYRVVETDQDTLKVVPDKYKDNTFIITYPWQDFAGWRSK